MGIETKSCNKYSKTCYRNLSKDQAKGLGNHLPGRIKKGFTKKVIFVKLAKWDKSCGNSGEILQIQKIVLRIDRILFLKQDWKEGKGFSGEWYQDKYLMWSILDRNF